MKNGNCAGYVNGEDRGNWRIEGESCESAGKGSEKELCAAGLVVGGSGCGSGCGGLCG